MNIRAHVRDVLQLLPGVIVSSRPFRPVAAMLRQGSLYLQPCNPAVGGPAKSQLVHEVDALGGEMGRMADLTYLQKRVLNRSKVTAARLAANRLRPACGAEWRDAQENSAPKDRSYSS